MIMQFANLNWLSVLAAFIAYFILGGLWFTVFFQKPYAISLGKAGLLPEKPAPIFIVGPAICSLVITLANAILIYSLNISTVSGALEFSAIVGIGYLVANTVNIAINPNIPKPILYGTISGVYHLIGIIIVSLIIVLMR